MSSISDQEPQISRRYHRIEREEEGTGDFDDDSVDVEIESERRVVKRTAAPQRRSLLRTIVTILIWVLIFYVLWRLWNAWRASNNAQADGQASSQDVSAWWTRQTAFLRDDPNNPDDLNDRWRRLLGRGTQTTAAAPAATTVAPAPSAIRPAPVNSPVIVIPGPSAPTGMMNNPAPGGMMMPPQMQMVGGMGMMNMGATATGTSGADMRANPFYADAWNTGAAPSWNTMNATSSLGATPMNNISWNTQATTTPDFAFQTYSATNVNNNNTNVVQSTGFGVPCPSGKCGRGLYPGEEQGAVDASQQPQQNSYYFNSADGNMVTGTGVWNANNSGSLYIQQSTAVQSPY